MREYGESEEKLTGTLESITQKYNQDAAYNGHNLALNNDGFTLPEPVSPYSTTAESFDEEGGFAPLRPMLPPGLKNGIENPTISSPRQIRNANPVAVAGLTKSEKLLCFPPEDIDVLLKQISARHNLDVDLFTAMIFQESRFNKNAKSSAGAQGLGQIMPRTAISLGLNNRPWTPLNPNSVWNPEANLDGAARYISTQLKRFGRVDLALAAYNAGPNRKALKLGRVPEIKETQDYVRKITGYMALRKRVFGR